MWAFTRAIWESDVVIWASFLNCIRNERSSIERGSETGKGRESITREHETVKCVGELVKVCTHVLHFSILRKISLYVYIIQACLQLMISLVWKHWEYRHELFLQKIVLHIGCYYAYLSSNILCFPKSHTYQLSTLNFLAIWMDCFY